MIHVAAASDAFTAFGSISLMHANSKAHLDISHEICTIKINYHLVIINTLGYLYSNYQYQLFLYNEVLSIQNPSNNA